MLYHELDACLAGTLRDAGAGKWLFYPDDVPVIIQMEMLLDDSLLIYCSFARDGSGLFLASFMTVLMTEDILAPAHRPHCTGTAQNRSAGSLHYIAGSVSVTCFTRLCTKAVLPTG